MGDTDGRGDPPVSCSPGRGSTDGTIRRGNAPVHWLAEAGVGSGEGRRRMVAEPATPAPVPQPPPTAPVAPATTVPSVAPAPSVAPEAPAASALPLAPAPSVASALSWRRVLATTTGLCVARRMPPAGAGRRPRPGRPHFGRPGSGRPGSGRPGSGRSSSGWPGPGRPRAGRPLPGRPRLGRPRTGWPRAGWPRAGRPGPGRNAGVRFRWPARLLRRPKVSVLDSADGQAELSIEFAAPDPLGLLTGGARG
jgi:hypothetical protein